MELYAECIHLYRFDLIKESMAAKHIEYSPTMMDKNRMQKKQNGSAYMRP